MAVLHKNLLFLTTFPRKLSFFRTFPSNKSRGSYLISRIGKWHGCPVVVPQAYVRYKRDQAFVTSKNASSFSNKVFRVANNKPSRDLRGQASATLRADHRRQLIPPRTPEARVATELSLRACTLREQYPGARARAPRQKGAHTERRPRPRRMDNGALAYANKAEAATTSKLKLAS